MPPKTSINIAPLVDVVLVLLIIFIVIVPALRTGFDVQLPPEPQGPPPRPAPSIVLGIDGTGCPAARSVLGPGGLPADCRVTLNGDVLAAGALPARLADVFRPRAAGDRVLFVAAEDAVNYEAVVRLVDEAKRAVGGDLRIALASDPHAADAR